MIVDPKIQEMCAWLEGVWKGIADDAKVAPSFTPEGRLKMEAFCAGAAFAFGAMPSLLEDTDDQGSDRLTISGGSRTSGADTTD
jgi:hypothetical protein